MTSARHIPPWQSLIPRRFLPTSAQKSRRNPITPDATVVVWHPLLLVPRFVMMRHHARTRATAGTRSFSYARGKREAPATDVLPPPLDRGDSVVRLPDACDGKGSRGNQADC